MLEMCKIQLILSKRLKNHRWHQIELRDPNILILQNLKQDIHSETWAYFFSSPTSTSLTENFKVEKLSIKYFWVLPT